jgi:hypothetical protein
MEKGAQEAGKYDTALSSHRKLDDFPGLVNGIYFSFRGLQREGEKPIPCRRSMPAGRKRV